MNTLENKGFDGVEIGGEETGSFLCKLGVFQILVTEWSKKIAIGKKNLNWFDEGQTEVSVIHHHINKNCNQLQWRC